MYNVPRPFEWTVKDDSTSPSNVIVPACSPCRKVTAVTAFSANTETISTRTLSPGLRRDPPYEQSHKPCDLEDHRIGHCCNGILPVPDPETGHVHHQRRDEEDDGQEQRKFHAG